MTCRGKRSFGGKHSRHVAPPEWDNCTARKRNEPVNMDEKTKAETDLETRLTQLSLAVKRAESIIESGKRVAIKRHLEASQTTAKEASQCKLALEAIKIAEKEEQAVINDWSDKIDEKFDEADEATMNLPNPQYKNRKFRNTNILRHNLPNCQSL